MSPIVLLVLALTAGSILLLLIVRLRRRHRRPPRITRTCVTCDNLGTSALCDECSGSGRHWVERVRRPE